MEKDLMTRLLVSSVLRDLFAGHIIASRCAQAISRSIVVLSMLVRQFVLFVPEGTRLVALRA